MHFENSLDDLPTLNCQTDLLVAQIRGVARARTKPERSKRSTTPVTLGGRINKRSLRSVKRRPARPSVSAALKIAQHAPLRSTDAELGEYGCMCRSNSPKTRITSRKGRILGR